MRIASLRIGLVISFLSAQIGLSAAQSISQLPTCAQNCVSQVFSTTSCDLLDLPCICNDQSLVPSLTTCLNSACAPEFQDATLQYLAQICATAGVTAIGNPSQAAPTVGTAPLSTPGGSLLVISGTDPINPIDPTTPTGPTARSTSSSQSSSVDAPTPLPSGSNTQSQPSNTSTGSQVSNTSPPTTRSSQPPASTSAPPVSGTRSKLSAAAIAGIAVGVGVPILVAIGVVAYRYNMNRKLLDVPVVPLHNDPNMTNLGTGIGGIEDQRPGWGSGIQDQSRSGWK